MNDILFKEIVFSNIKKQTYFLSEDGQVYSKSHNKILKWKLDTKGYAYVTLATNDGKNKEFYIAKLVVETYIGPPPKTMAEPTIDHKNNRKLDNHFLNLQWMERLENNAKITPITKLTEEEVHQVCKLLEQGINANRISKQFAVTSVAIYNIKKKKNWVHISSQYNI